MRRKKYFSEEYVFALIWQNADHDGIWHGDAASLAAEFDVTEDETHSALSQLCGRRIIQRVYKQTYIIVNWHETESA